jgi:hypothetical protein
MSSNPNTTHAHTHAQKVSTAGLMKKKEYVNSRTHLKIYNCRRKGVKKLMGFMGQHKKSKRLNYWSSRERKG